jgi:hypothetical protein
MSRSALASAGTNKNQVNFSSAALKTIQEIQFGIFSPEDVKKMSVVEVLFPEMMVMLFLRLCDSDADGFRMKLTFDLVKMVWETQRWDPSTVLFIVLPAVKTCRTVKVILVTSS